MILSGLLCAIGWGSLGHVCSLIAVLLPLLLWPGSASPVCMPAEFRLAVKWFPDKRGIASGIITAGYGMGAAAFNPLFRSPDSTIGYSDTFLWTGISHGGLIVLSGLVMVNPPATYKVAAAAAKRECPAPRSPIHLLGNAAHAAVLFPVRRDVVGRDRRADGHRVGEAGGDRFRDRCRQR